MSTVTMQECLARLEQEIRDGVLVPGQKLKIAMLKERYGAGQSPLREALSKLVGMGLVQAEENRGFRVAPMSEGELKDLSETMAQIETLALAQAIERGTDQWESGVVRALHELYLVESKTTPPAFELWDTRNAAFHRALLEGCGSPSLMSIRDDLYGKWERYRRLTFAYSQQPLLLNHEEHRAIAQAALQRDAPAACALLREHLTGALPHMLQVLKAQLQEVDHVD